MLNPEVGTRDGVWVGVFDSEGRARSYEEELEAMLISVLDDCILNF